MFIVGRGGVSLEDLWAFNEEITVRAIYNSRIPVISAVGHEVDWTIADFTADLRAPTPSAAAELVVRQKEDLCQELEHCFIRMRNTVENKIGVLSRELLRLKNAYVLKYPLNFIQVYLQKIDELNHRLVQRSRHILEVAGHSFARLTEKLEALSPLKVLSRGYSITFKLPNLEVITDISQINTGDRIETRVKEGSLVSEVINKKTENREQRTERREYGR